MDWAPVILKCNGGARYLARYESRDLAKEAASLFFKGCKTGRLDATRPTAYRVRVGSGYADFVSLHSARGDNIGTKYTHVYEASLGLARPLIEEDTEE